MTFPFNIDSFVAKVNEDVVDPPDVNDLQNSVVAIEEALGAGSYGISGPCYPNVLAAIQNYAADTGVANAYQITLIPGPVIPLVAGLVVRFLAANANTGPSTLSINGGTAVNIYKSVDVDLAAGDIQENQIIEVVFDGTNYQIPYASGLTLPLSLADGGTGAALAASLGGIVYCGAGALAILGGTSTANQLLMSGASSAPSWSTATYPETVVAQNILFGSATNEVGQISTADDGVLVTDGAGNPSIASTLPSAVQSNITGVGTVASGTWQGSAVGIAYGGTGASSAPAAFDALSPMTTLGDTLYGGTAGAGTRLAGTTSTTKQFLTQTGTGTVSAAPVWSPISSTDLPTFPGASTLSDYSTAFVNSITGTSDQVIASASVGAVTLSLPQSIATSSTPQFAGLGIGTAANVNCGVYLNPSFSSASLPQVGILNEAAFDTTSAIYGYYAAPSLAASTAAADYFAVYAHDVVLGSGASVSGTSYGLYVGNIASGAINYAIYSAGSSLSLLNGALAVGGSGGSTTSIQLLVTGTVPAGSSTQRAIYNGVAFGSGATANGQVFLSAPQTVAADFTMSNLFHFEVVDVILGSGSAVTTSYGLYVGTLSAASNNWGIYVNDNNSYFGGNVKVTGQVEFYGTNTTGSGSAALGSNCPAATASAPHTWIKAISSDGSTVYIPCWK